MSAPRICKLKDAPASIRDQLPSLPHREGVALFVVLSAGVCCGASWSAGDVVVCRGEVEHGDSTVLVARRGRPRFGTVWGEQLLGEAGEPCHPVRWQAAGRAVARYRRGAQGWFVDLLEREARQPVPEVQPKASPAAVADAQLSLFAA